MRSFLFILSLCTLAALAPPHALAGARLTLGGHATLGATLIVSPGATEAKSGANLLSAIDAAAGSADQPCRVKLEPGSYDVGASGVEMKPFVDIVGSGRDVTVITGSRGGLSGIVENDFSNAAIRDVTVRNTFTGEDLCVGIHIGNGASPLIHNVTVEAVAGCREPIGIDISQASPVLNGVSVKAAGSGTTVGVKQVMGVADMRDLSVSAMTSATQQSVYALMLLEAGSAESPARLQKVRAVAAGGFIAYGLRLGSGEAELRDITCRVSEAAVNYAIYLHKTAAADFSASTAAAQGGTQAAAIVVNDGQASFTHVTATAAGATGDATGLRCATAGGARTVRVRSCQISGGSFSIYETDTDYTLNVGLSRLDGPVSAKGTLRCIDCYDPAGADLDAACRP